MNRFTAEVLPSLMLFMMAALALTVGNPVWPVFRALVVWIYPSDAKIEECFRKESE